MKRVAFIVTILALIACTMPSAAQQSAVASPITPLAGQAWPAASLQLPLANGATLERMSWLGKLGWMQLTVIKIDLGAQSLKVEPVLANAALSSPARPTEVARENGLIAAVNGDFFDLGATGGPLSLVASEGRVIRSPRVDPDFATIAITRNGQAIMGQWDWEGRLESAGGEISVTLAAMNEISVAQDSAVLYTPEWTWPRPQSQSDAVFVAIADGVVTAAGVGYPAAGAGTYVVARGSQAKLLRRLAVGDAVTVSYGLRPGFDGLAAAFSGKPVLVIDGNEAAGLLKHTGISAALPAPRTAAGITADGHTLILAVVDGRLAGARGATLPEMAKIMIELGAVSALNLDGGASSAVVARDPVTGAMTSANRPSGATERPVPYVIGLAPVAARPLTAAPATGPNALAAPGAAAEHVVIGTAAADAGEAIEAVEAVEVTKLTGATDAAAPRAPQPSSAPAFIAVEADMGVRTYTFPSLSRIVADNARFITGDELVCPAGAHLRLRVVAFDENMNRAAVNSAAEPVWQVLHPKGVRSQEDAVAAVWRQVAGGAEIEFHPLPGSRTQISVVWPGADGSVSNTVCFAVRSDDLPLAAPATIAGSPQWVILESFESGGAWMAAASSPTVSAFTALAVGAPWDVAQGLTAPVVPVGNALSLRFDLRSPEPTRAAYARAPRPLLLPEGAQSVGMWVWSDGNGHWLRATITDSAGAKYPLDFARLDWVGWRFVTAALPGQASGSVALSQVYVVEFKTELGASGEVFIDQVCAMAAPRAAQVDVVSPTPAPEAAAATPEGAPAASPTTVTIGSGSIQWARLRAQLDEFKLSPSRELTVVLEGRTLAASPSGIVRDGKLTMGGSLGDAVAAELLLRMAADCLDGSTKVTVVQEDAALTESGETRAVVDGVLLIWRAKPAG